MLLVDVALAQLPARSAHEVDDAFLRLDPLVEMVVAGEHDADVVLEEQRLEHLAQPLIRAVAVARRVERMVEVRDLPVLVRVLQLLLEPRDLLRVQVGALEREEPDVLLGALNV